MALPMPGPRKYVVHFDHGLCVTLGTGEMKFPDGRSGILRGQPLTALEALAQRQGWWVGRIALDEQYGIRDPGAVIKTLRRILGDVGPEFRYVVNVYQRGYRLDHYRLEIIELPPLDF